MTKRQTIDQLRYLLKKHDGVNHGAIIEVALNDVYNQILKDATLNFEFYTKTYEATGAQDAASDRYCVTLPAAIVPLNNPTDAIATINSKKGIGYRFYPTTENEVAVYDGLESDDADSHYGYYLQGNKVWFTNFDDELAAAGVRMALVVQFKEYAMTDEVPIPDGYNVKQLVIDYLKQTNIIDLQNIQK